MYILLAAAAVTGTLSLGGEDMLMDTVVIMCVVLLNALLGFFQEGKTEAALEALQNMLVASCTVIRDGREEKIATRQLVPGDIVLLGGGDKVPADLRLFYVKNATADESPLTGESNPAPKQIAPITKPDQSPADQRCMAFSGTFLSTGTARGVVVKIGENTEFGKIAQLVRQTKLAPTPLQRKIAGFTKILMISILARIRRRLHTRVQFSRVGVPGGCSHSRNAADAGDFDSGACSRQNGGTQCPGPAATGSRDAGLHYGHLLR